MADESGDSIYLDYLFPLAEKELGAFFHAVELLFGMEQARRSALAWIQEVDVMNWQVGRAIPRWREVTIRASARLVLRIPETTNSWRRRLNAGLAIEIMEDCVRKTTAFRK